MYFSIETLSVEVLIMPVKMIEFYGFSLFRFIEAIAFQ